MYADEVIRHNARFLALPRQRQSDWLGSSEQRDGGMSGGKIALLVVGIIFLVGALVLVVGGGGLMWWSQTLENDNPVFASRETSLRKADAYAIVTEPFEIDWYDEPQDEGWWQGDVGTARVEAESRDSSKGVFIGIARDTDVDDYLSGVRYCEVVGWSSDPFNDAEVEYQPHSGSLVPSDPTAETLWEASAHGPGRQTVDWKPEMGRWVLVFMNEDGSEDIDVSGSLGAEPPWLFWLGLGLLPLGVVVLVGGGVMIFFAARRPNRSVIQATVPVTT